MKTFKQFLSEDYHFMSERGATKPGLRSAHDIWYCDTQYGMVGVHLYTKLERIGNKGSVLVQATGPQKITHPLFPTMPVNLHGPDNVDSVQIGGAPVKFQVWFSVPDGRPMKKGPWVKWGNDRSYVDPEGFEREIHAEMSRVAVAFWKFISDAVVPERDTRDAKKTWGFVTPDGSVRNATDGERISLYDSAKRALVQGGVHWDNTDDLVRVFLQATKKAAQLALEVIDSHPEAKRVCIWIMGRNGACLHKTPKTAAGWHLNDSQPTCLGKEEAVILLKNAIKASKA